MDNMDGVHHMGVLNALKTGDMFMDMILAMCIPVILRTLFTLVSGQKLQEYCNKIYKWLFAIIEEEYQDDYHYRNVSHTVEKNKYDGFNPIDADSHNDVLIKAITMYLHHLQITKLPKANLRLTTLTGNNSSNNDEYYDSDDDSDDEDNTYAGTLSGYTIVKNPPEGVWHTVGKKYQGEDPKKKNGKKKPDTEKAVVDPKKIDSNKVEEEDREEKKFLRKADGTKVPLPDDGMYDVEFVFGDKEEQSQEDDEDNDNEDGSSNNINNNSNNKKNNKKIIKERREKSYEFRSLGENSIDAFIDEAYAWYIKEIRQSEKDTTRYMFDMKKTSSPSSMDGDENSNKTHTFKRYKLSDEKTFDSLVFREKTTIVKLFRHFLDKTGKYGIKGYPQKLGLLLHGPPGTGKTSLIKAVAEYTGRHIVNIPLARIKTNEELTQLFFSGEYNIDGQYWPQKLGFKDVIFVMEDVDAASKVVQRRDGKKTAEVTQTQQVDLPAPKCMWQMLMESNHDDCKELVEKLMEKSERLKDKALASETMHSLAKRLNAIPGMTLVGHHESCSDPMDAAMGTMESNTIKKISESAIDVGKGMMSDCEALDEYLSFHAKAMKKMLEMGAKVDEAFENELLGLTIDDTSKQTVTARSTMISREVEVNKFGDDDVEMDVKNPMSLLDFGGGPSGPHGGEKQQGPSSMGASGPSGLDMLMGLGALGGGGGGYGRFGKGGFGGGVGGGNNNNFTDDLSLTGVGGGGRIGKGWGSSTFSTIKDPLNLSGLLNVLDGVVDTPDRILIMTSNHPEKLDPALIRPGRIDKKLMLGYMEGEDVCDMLEHYFQQPLNDIQKNRVCKAISGGDGSHTTTTTTNLRPALNMTPAQVEQLTAEHDEIDDMIHALENKGAPLVETPFSSMEFSHSLKGTQVKGGGAGGGVSNKEFMEMLLPPISGVPPIKSSEQHHQPPRISSTGTTTTTNRASMHFN